MNPLVLGRQVERGLRDLVRSTLNTTSPAFDGMVDRFLAEPRNFLQGPWISVAMPFRQSSTPGEHFPEIPLGFAPFKHQEIAFDRLGGDTPSSTLIATGTGSGKTESYLWPIFDHCRRHKGEPGIKAILIYPMNALATDQAKRIAAAIHRLTALTGVRCGIFADSEPKPPAHEMTVDGVITSREEMRKNPPDILLTNYKMLDYLLLRGNDRRLWEQNQSETLRFLVVDEMHTFDGAQGADLALLIRRLKSRVRTPANHLACVGSSATLGSSDEAARKLIAYAEEIFGERFDQDAVIREDRIPAQQFLSDPDYLDMPDPAEISIALARTMSVEQPVAALEIARCFFPELDPDHPDFAQTLSADPGALDWRIALGRGLKEHVAVRRVLTIIAETKGPSTLASIREGFSGSKLFRGWADRDLENLAEATVSLIAWARGEASTPKRHEPLLNVRIQFWARELARMVANTPHLTADGIVSEAALAHSDDLDPGERAYFLPLIHCGSCGTSGHLGRISEAGGNLWAEPRTLYEGFFDGAERIRLIYHESVSRLTGSTGGVQLATGYLDPETLTFKAMGHSPSDAPLGHAPVWIHNPIDPQGKIDRTCPACGAPHSLQIFGLRAARLTSALANTLYTSEQNELEPEEKPRLLLFSDSVQDAAQRAAVAEIRNTQSVIRKSLFKAVEASPEAGLTLEEITKDLPEQLSADLGGEAFLARFISWDQVWRSEFVEFLKTGEIIRPDPILADTRMRLGWEYFSELTYRSHTSQTLEAARLIAAEPFTEKVVSVAEQLPDALREHVDPTIRMDELQARMFLSGLLQQMRRRGAVGHPYVRLAMERYRKGRGPGYYEAMIALGLGKRQVLPFIRPRRFAAPLPVTLRSNMEGYEQLLRNHSSNWYMDWADRFFLSGGVFSGEIYPQLFRKTFDLLEAEGVVRRIEQQEDQALSGYVIEPSAILVSDHLLRLCCERCSRQEIALADDEHRIGSPCTRIACSGKLRLDEGATGNPHMQGLMASPRNHRVVAREHTGILDSDKRRELETQFITGGKPWSPNLISATPTLEMGIDIGDLSTLLLCSVPPLEANYVQRIGRTGRRDGNSLNLTIANARPHDLQFWEEPGTMLLGEVGAPGVYLEAIAVLRRQVAAYTLDRLILTSADAADYGKVKSILTSLEDPKTSKFPLDWFAFVEAEGENLAEEFLGFLPEIVGKREHIRKGIRSFLGVEGPDDETLIWKVRNLFAAIRRERDELRQMSKDLDKEQRRLRNESPPRKDLEERIQEIQKDKGEIRHTIKVSINEVSVLQLLTDRGILPNYAFPEEGVTLKSIVTKRSDVNPTPQVIAEGQNLQTQEYVRPATAALTELAPRQTFYADGREVEVSRIDLSSKDLAIWRFCQRCSHAEREITAKAHTSCPKCTDEMWADAGSRHESVELRTVIAVTSEQRAPIKDSDDRSQQQFDRAMFPFYTESAIEQAWASVNKERSTPFGFEFISGCEFRDVNFGKRSAAPNGAPIAGEPRKSYPFLICRHCGKIQFPAKDEADSGDHQARCLALQKQLPRKEWEASVFLMRRFSTEAIRVIMPVVGEADHNDIKSFVAGVDLGMRKHFEGKVDHIRSVVVEEKIEGQIGVRSLYLYDTVPGGSGYLRQLAERPETLRGVIEKAAESLRDCACTQDPDKDGCFRCVRSYRSQFGPGDPSRDTARAMMEDVLVHWDHLKRVESGVNRSIRDDMVESVLERRFLDALRQTFGPESLKPKLLPGARQAYQLNAGNESRSVFWTIETQVQIDKRVPGAPRKRVDFLLSPAGGVKASGTAVEPLPIVVEMDGLTNHAATAAEDIENRLGMIRTNKLRVWSLAWDDLSRVHDERVPNPFHERKLEAGMTGRLAAILQAPGFEDIRPHVDALRMLQSAGSLDGLFACLRVPEMRFDQAVTLLSRILIGPTGKQLDTLPRIAEISDDGKIFLGSNPLHGHQSDKTLDVYISAPTGAPGASIRDLDAYRILLRGTLPRLEENVLRTAGLSEAWRGLWRMINFLQDLRGFHVEFEGMEAVAAPDMSRLPEGADDLAWQEAETLADEGFLPLLRELKAGGFIAPDLIGQDAMADDAVVGLIEVGWSSVMLGLTEHRFEMEDWSIIEIDPEDGAPLSAALDRIIVLLNKKETTR